MRRSDLPDLLFDDGELGLALDNNRERMLAEIRETSEDYLLNVDIGEWVAHLVDKYRVSSPILHPERWEVEDKGEAQVDVSHDYMRRAIVDPSQPAYVPGRRLLLRIPFSGDSQVFRLRARRRSFSPLRANVADGEIRLPIEYPTDTDRPDIKARGDELVAALERHLSWSKAECDAHNNDLEQQAQRAIENRRKRVLADHSHLDNIGIPLRQRKDAPKTYQAPGITRRRPPQQSEVKNAKPRSPEPTLVGGLYEHALSVIRAMARAMERTPADYASLGEERLRDQLLVMLNTHYEGQGQAEAFNKGGKTDILIRVEDRNVFIAECKIWEGPKGLDAALNQLFSYATWRDTKLALIFFVHRKSIGTVIEKIRAGLEVRDEFGSWQNSEEDELRCQMGWPNDPERRADLAVLLAHLPK